MTPWNEIKNLALELIQRDFPSANMDHLNEWILASFYPQAPIPHMSTRDLIYTYAASLRNAGGPGPRFDRFAAIVADTVSHHWIHQNTLAPFDLPQLAQMCLARLDDEGVQPFVDNGTADYPEQLRRIGAGENIAPQIMQSLMQSIVLFSNLLSNSYNGVATDYHESFFKYPNETAAQFAFRKFQEICHFPRIGIAVAMNFFKDSQVPSLMNVPWGGLNSNFIAWFAKPDKHISRLMLYETGRAHRSNINPNALASLPDHRCFQICRAYPPGNGFSNDYTTQAARDSIAQWQCIEEIHYRANIERISPLEIDRVLYLIGSGRFGAGMLRTKQVDRYHEYCALVDNNMNWSVFS